MMLKVMKVYVGEPLKFSSSSLGRKLREGFLERSSHFGVNLFFYLKFAVRSALTQKSQLELETGPSESSPTSQSESAARLLPDSAASTSEILMTPPKR